MIAEAKIVGSGLRSKTPVLAEYAKDFYRWDVSPFIKRQQAKGRGFNRHWANGLQSMMEHHVFQRFGRMRLDALTRPMSGALLAWKEIITGEPAPDLTRRGLAAKGKRIADEQFKAYR